MSSNGRKKGLVNAETGGEDRTDSRVAPRVLAPAAICRFLAGGAAMALAAMLGASDARAEGGGSLRDTVDVSGADEADQATLEADQITYDPDTEIVRASGDVRVFYAGRVLRADAIVYDARSDRISAQGEITVVNPDGSVIVADSADFDTQIRDGLIRGARAVLADGRSRIAAVEARRVDGEITTMSKAVYSPCETCRDNPTPLWRIRARKIIHDEGAQRITYEDATFEVAGVPVAWLPFFSHADPTVKRRSGFLTPSLSSSDELGFGTALTYYWAIEQNRDLTASMFVYTEENPLFFGEYRALERYGAFNISGSATWSDDPLERGFRGHFIGNGRFSVGSGFILGFDALIASDDTFLRRYDFSSVDRAAATLYLENFGQKGFIAAEATRFQSFREGEFAGELPQILPHVDGERVYDAPYVGGTFTIGGDALWLQRTEGRDVGRLSASASWERAFVSSTGLVIETTAKIRGDVYSVQDDDVIDPGARGRVLPLGAATFSYPLGKTTTGASHVLEPIGVLVVAPYGGDDPTEFANEDSQDFELDETSIFAIERVTGLDRWEEGPRATVGVRYTRDAIGKGFNVDIALGQSFRLRDTDVFSENSGLSEEVSDFVGSWRVENGEFFTVGHRFRVSDDGDLKRNEVYAQVQPLSWIRLDGTFVHLAADPAIEADVDRTEGFLSAEVDVARYWTIVGDVRRDFEEDRFVSAGGGVRYADECLELDFRVGRRFNSVEDAPAETRFDFSIKLLGVDGY